MLSKLLCQIPDIKQGSVAFVRSKELLLFTEPIDVLVAATPGEVSAVLEMVEKSTVAGRYAAGFLAYEAASAFDTALVTHAPGVLPLAWFGVYDRVSLRAPLPNRWFSERTTKALMDAWTPLVDSSAYDEAVTRIHDYIQAGDAYQVNYTFPMISRARVNPWEIFLRLCPSQQSEYRAFVHTGAFQILSLSPELFFSLDGNRLETRPMKGTAPRGRWCAEDRRQAADLKQNPKERAENVMIVDLLRNDLGRISETGSVTVERLFETEQYETLWQMTSTVASRTSAPMPEIMTALFPSGSVTGAPKVRAMQIIRELEHYPRGVYCGAVGWCGPERKAVFNVGIRTITVETATAAASYHVGSGITWDARSRTEYQECRLKAAVLQRPADSFSLVESLLWDGGYFLEELHLSRIMASAAYFGFGMDREALAAGLATRAGQLREGAWKVRLLLDADGKVRTEAEPAPDNIPLTLSLAVCPMDPSCAMLYHKTTRRESYDRARPSDPEAGAVLLWNSRGEITESTFANVVVRRAGAWVTPPLECGLLPGVMRESLLKAGVIHEAVIRVEDLVDCEEIALINSVRKWIPARLL